MAEVDGAQSVAVSRGPDRAALEDWLRHRAVGPRGEVWSWISESNPGYGYPEAAGLWLACLGPDERVARWLSDRVSDGGGVGRAGIDYLFDTAIALSGLLEHEARGGSVDPGVLARMFELIAGCVDRRVAVVGDAHERRWSTSWTPHLMKVAIAAERYGRRTGDPRGEAVIRRLLSDFRDWQQDGWFPSRRDEPSTYVHASSYAVEGLMYLGARGVDVGRSALRTCGDALALLQLPSGGMPAWSGGGAGVGPRADATAQAVRIWCAVDAGRFAENIEGATRALARLQSPSGAIVYEQGSADANTWASLFAWQALRWVEEGPRIECLA